MPPKGAKAKTKEASDKERSPSPQLSQAGDESISEKKSKGRGRPSGSQIKKKRKVDDRDHKRHVGIVLRQIHPGMTMSSSATRIMNSFLQDCFERISDEAGRLGHHLESKQEKFKLRFVYYFRVSCPNMPSLKVPKP